MADVTVRTLLYTLYKLCRAIAVLTDDTNIPTLTVFRLVLIAPFLMLLYQHEYVYAFYIFLAGFTDGLDGWLARYFHWQSPLARLLIRLQINCSLLQVLFL